MIKLTCKCIKCGGDYIQERGGGAKPINVSHLCDTCLNPPKPKPVAAPVFVKETVKKKG